MSTKVEGFSISHAAILDGTTGAEATGGDIFAVRSGSIQLNQNSYDNSGDDVILSTWNWIDYATVSIESGYVPFDLIALLTGSELTTSGAGANAGYNIPLWEEGTESTAPKPMLIRVPSRDAEGNQRNLDFVLYKVQFSPMSFQGPSYKQGLITSYTGRALMSEIDEKGRPLTKRAVGRLVSYTV
jgi:hypothetical protein